MGKSPFFLLTLLYLYKKKKKFGLPQMNFGLPQRFNPKFCLIVSARDLYNILHFKTKSFKILYEEGPSCSLMNFFHAWASAAIPSNLEGLRKHIFFSYLAAWFLTPSILAGLRHS